MFRSPDSFRWLVAIDLRPTSYGVRPALTIELFVHFLLDIIRIILKLNPIKTNYDTLSILLKLPSMWIIQHISAVQRQTTLTKNRSGAVKPTKTSMNQCRNRWRVIMPTAFEKTAMINTIYTLIVWKMMSTPWGMDKLAVMF